MHLVYEHVGTPLRFLHQKRGYCLLNCINSSINNLDTATAQMYNSNELTFQHETFITGKTCQE
jgi:hypothetical protein